MESLIQQLQERTLPVTPKQLASMLGISRSTVSRMVQRGAIRAYHVGGQLRFEPAEVISYLEGV